MLLGQVVCEEVAVGGEAAAGDHLARPERPAIDIDQQRPLVLRRPVIGLEHVAVYILPVPVLVGEELRDGPGELLSLLGMGVRQHFGFIGIGADRNKLGERAVIHEVGQGVVPIVAHRDRAVGAIHLVQPGHFAFGEIDAVDIAL